MAGVAGLCEHGDEQLVSVRCGEFGNFLNRGVPTLNSCGGYVLGSLCGTESRTDEVSNRGMMGFGFSATGLSHFFQYLRG
jgi:hypothetical protein